MDRGQGTEGRRQDDKIPRESHNGIDPVIGKAVAGARLDEAEIVSLFNARGADEALVIQAADDLRRTVNGDTVSYVVNRNINYTNICYFGCGFCAFSKGRVAENLRERGYDLPLAEIQARVTEAWERGATEVCLQGGIHPDYTGATYLAIVRAVKQAQPDMHVHAFSPLEIRQGAETLGLPLRDYLEQLKQAGLGTLPGTAAEILDDEIRQIICPDKLNTAEWLEVMGTAHSLGLNSTATIMFGHVDGPLNWARHLLRVRDLQEQTGGFTEFVPLPFVHMEAPMYRKGRARKGPTFPRSPADARGRQAGAAPAYHQHTGLLGEAGHGRDQCLPGCGRQRPGRHPDEREHQPRRRRIPRPGVHRRRHAQTDHGRGQGTATAHHPLRVHRRHRQPGSPACPNAKPGHRNSCQ